MFFFFFKQKTAYEMRISDWSSDVCSSDLHGLLPLLAEFIGQQARQDVGGAAGREGHDQGDAAGGVGGLGLAGGGRQQGGQGQGGGGCRLGPCFHDLSPVLLLLAGFGVRHPAGAWHLAKSGQAGNSTMASPVATVSPRWLVTCTSSVAHWLLSS